MQYTKQVAKDTSPSQNLASQSLTKYKLMFVNTIWTYRQLSSMTRILVWTFAKCKFEVDPVDVKSKTLIKGFFINKMR